MSETLATPGRRHVGIDMLRGIAVLLVLGRHLNSPVNCPEWMQTVLGLWRQGGWVGVDLFFVLSGFLVSGLLFQDYRQHGQLHVGRFYVRRGLKIYPGFYALLAVTIAMVCLVFRKPVPVQPLLTEAAFLQNYVGFQSGTLWNHTWSLAVEEHFYLTLPLLLLAFTKTSRRADPFVGVPLMCIVVAVGLTGWRCWQHTAIDAEQYPRELMQYLTPTHLRFDSLLTGVALSYFAQFRREMFTRFAGANAPVLAVCGVLLLAPAFLWAIEVTPWLTSFGVTLFYIGSGCLVCAVVGRAVHAGPVVRGLAAIGYYSYSIYLWHLAVKFWIAPLAIHLLKLPRTYAIDSGLYLILSLVVGIAMAKLIEVPVLALREKWFPSPVTSAINLSAAASETAPMTIGELLANPRAQVAAE